MVFCCHNIDMNSETMDNVIQYPLVRARISSTALLEVRRRDFNLSKEAFHRQSG